MTNTQATSQTSDVQGRRNPLWLGLPARLARTRKRAELSQRKLGLLAGLSNSTVSNIEARANVPGIDLIERIATVLGVPPGWLAFGPEGCLPFRQRQVSLSEQEAADPPVSVQQAASWERFRTCGVRVRQIREHLGLTLRDVASAATLTFQSIQLIEVGGTAPKVETVECVAVALDVPPGWLAFGDEEGPNDQPGTRGETRA